MEQEYSSNLRELKAESVLSLYDLQDFAVEMKGIFHRNYSPDLMSKPTDKDKIELSRDSIYHLLPENLFFGDNELKNSENLKEKKRKRKLFFQPFDNEYFNFLLKLEKEINNIFGKYIFNMTSYPNWEMPQKTAEDTLDVLNLSDFASEIRGNETLIVDILKIILNVSKIELIKNDNSAYQEPIRKTFIIHIPKLSNEEYFQKSNQVVKMFEIFKEYFLPFDMEYDFKIKDKQQKFILSENLILDYNTNI